MASVYERVFLGATLVSLSVVLLLSGLGTLKFIGKSEFIVSEQLDVIIAFAALAIGLSYLYSEIKGK